MPVGAQPLREQGPGVQQAVEALLVVQPTHGDYAVVAGFALDVRHCDGGVGHDGQVWQVPPHFCILPRQDDEVVETTDDLLVLFHADAVRQAQQALAVVLQAEQLVIMQFQHLQAAVRDVRDEGRLRRIEGDYDIGLLAHQQLGQCLAVLLAPAQIAERLGNRVAPVVVLVVDTEIHHLHFRREFVEWRTTMLVSGYDHQLVTAALHPPAKFVEEHPLHSARVVDIGMAVNEFHVVRWLVLLDLVQLIWVWKSRDYISFFD